MTHRFRLTPVLLILWLLTFGLQAVVIKIGSIAPSRSPWDKTLNELAVEWEKLSGGSVRINIYPGGIAGSEMDMLRKLRLGTLGGAVFTNMGMSKIIPDVVVLNTPFLITSEQEFNYVFERMKPLFEQQIEAKGFKVLLWTMAGWIYFFSKDKIIYPEDMKKHKLSFTTAEAEMEQAWKKMGYQIIPTDLKDLMMALQSGMVTAYYLPPLVAGSGQYFALTPHMLSLRMAPLVGGLVLTDKAWKSIAEQYREPMAKAVLKIAEGLLQRTQELEKDALKTMKENGLIIHDPPADALPRWREVASKGMDELVGKAFSKEIYERILAIIQEFKQRNVR